MINSPPEVVRHPVDLHVDIVQVPLPVAMGSHRFHPSLPDLGREHRSEPVPPVTHRFVVDLDPSLVEQVLDIAQGQREADVKHHRQTDDLKASLEVAEWGAFGHPARRAVHPVTWQPKFL